MLPAPPATILYTDKRGFLCPNGEPVNIRYLNQHRRPSSVGTWWGEATFFLNGRIVHAEVKRPVNWRRTSMTDIEPLLITGSYYDIAMVDIPLL
jgi:hypothetical protein